MKVLTLEEVIALPNESIVPAMSGLIAHVGPRTERTNPFTKLPYYQQMVVVADGQHRVVVMVDDPQDKHVGMLTDADKGKKLYLLAAPDNKGTLKYLKRGISKPSATPNGGMNHYVYAGAKAELEWALPNAGKAPAGADPLDPADGPAVEDGGFENATPATSIAATNVAAQVGEKTPAPIQGTIELWRPTNTNPAAALQLVVTHYESCVEEAINLCNRLNTKIGVVTGEGVNTSPQDLLKVADSLFNEANRRRVW